MNSKWGKENRKIGKGEKRSYIGHESEIS